MAYLQGLLGALCRAAWRAEAVSRLLLCQIGVLPPARAAFIIALKAALALRGGNKTRGAVRARRRLQSRAVASGERANRTRGDVPESKVEEEEVQ